MAKKFLKTLVNNLGFKILAVIFACVLWVVVYNINDPTQTKTYTSHVTIENADAISEMSKYYEILDGSNSVSFSVSAKKSVLEKIDESDFSVVADMSTVVISEDGTTGTVKINISCSKYDNSLKYNGKSKYLLIGLEDLMSKQFVITANTDGTVASGYALGTVSVSGTNVLKVSGPASVVSEISSVNATINVDGISTSISNDVLPVLYDGDGNVIDTTKLTLSITTVTINATVLGMKEIPLYFSSTGTPGAGYSVVGVTSEQETIQVKGASSVLNTLTALEIPPEVLNVEGMTDSITTTIDISEYLPEGCELVDNRQSVVSVTVQIEPYESRTYTVPVSYISIEGLADDRSLAYNNLTVEVEIGGVASVLDSLESSSLRFVLDASNLSVGTHIVKLELLDENADYDLIEGKAEVVVTRKTVSGGNSSAASGAGSSAGNNGSTENGTGGAESGGTGSDEDGSADDSGDQDDDTGE